MILKRMKRRHSREQTIDFCAAIRRVRHDIVFGADVIAGFPTETDDMFENSLRLMDELPVVYGHVFPYSPRPGTPAARMPQTNGTVIRERAARLRLAVSRVRQGYFASLVGKTATVLIEKGDMGHTETFAPVNVKGDVVPGHIYSCEITGVAGDTLDGIQIT